MISTGLRNKYFLSLDTVSTIFTAISLQKIVSFMPHSLKHLLVLTHRKYFLSHQTVLNIFCYLLAENIFCCTSDVEYLLILACRKYFCHTKQSCIFTDLSLHTLFSVCQQQAFGLSLGEQTRTSWPTTRSILKTRLTRSLQS